MLDQPMPTVLAVCTRNYQFESQGFLWTERGSQALEWLRVLRVDLLLVGSDILDMSPWQFVIRVRNAWPWHKWALLGTGITDDDEALARQLGACRILSIPFDVNEVYSLADAFHHTVSLCPGEGRNYPAGVYSNEKEYAN